MAATMPALPLPLPPPPMRCDAMRCITVRGYIPAPLKQDSSSAKAETGVSWSRISNVHVGRGRRRRQGTVSYVRHDTVVSGCCRARCSHRLNGWRPQRLLLGSLSLSILMRGSGAHLTRQREFNAMGPRPSTHLRPSKLLKCSYTLMATYTINYT